MLKNKINPNQRRLFFFSVLNIVLGILLIVFFNFVQEYFFINGYYHKIIVISGFNIPIGLICGLVVSLLFGLYLLAIGKTIYTCIITELKPIKLKGETQDVKS